MPCTRSAAGSVSVQIQTKMARSGQRFSPKQLPFLYTPVRAVYYYVKFVDFSKKNCSFSPLDFHKNRWLTGINKLLTATCSVQEDL